MSPWLTSCNNELFISRRNNIRNLLNYLVRRCTECFTVLDPRVSRRERLMAEKLQKIQKPTLSISAFLQIQWIYNYFELIFSCTFQTNWFSDFMVEARTLTLFAMFWPTPLKYSFKIFVVDLLKKNLQFVTWIVILLGGNMTYGQEGNIISNWYNNA